MVRRGGHRAWGLERPKLSGVIIDKHDINRTTPVVSVQVSTPSTPVLTCGLLGFQRLPVSSLISVGKKNFFDVVSVVLYLCFLIILLIYCMYEEFSTRKLGVRETILKILF